MQTLRKIFIYWFILFVSVTITAAMVYGAQQQYIRQSADDPQIQIAEDTAAALENGQPIDSFVPKNKIDMARSLSPFVMVYDQSKKIIGSSCTLNGNSPVLPEGVLDYAGLNGMDRLTWMPAPGVRIAAVVVKYGGAKPGFVAVGRSMREIEKRILHIEQLVGFIWLFSSLASFVVLYIGALLLNPRKSS